MSIEKNEQHERILPRKRKSIIETIQLSNYLFFPLHSSTPTNSHTKTMRKQQIAVYPLSLYIEIRHIIIIIIFTALPLVTLSVSLHAYQYFFV